MASADYEASYRAGQAAFTSGTSLRDMGTYPSSGTLHGWLDALADQVRPARQRPRVVIEVTGGVAEVATCPPNVDVEIIDHD